MNREQEEFISKCETCHTFQTSQQKEPLICHEVSQCSWENVGCDIFTYNNRDYLCIVDYYSDYIEIDELHKAKTGAAVIGKLKKRFATHGFLTRFTVTMDHLLIQTNFQRLPLCLSSNT